MPQLPVVYVRGFAGPTSGINSQVDDPFYGFNDGSTHVRINGDGDPQYYQFESPLLRLMIDEDYDLLVKGDQLGYLKQAASGQVPQASIWVFRFYDTAATTFGPQPSRGFVSRIWHHAEEHLSAPGFNLEDAAAGLYDFIELILERTGAPQVYLVAHSMGGLIARCMIQKVSQLPRDGVPRRPGKDLVAKLFTYGTPHRGIAFDVGILNWAMQQFGPAGADIFAPRKMIGYLDPTRTWGDLAPDDWDPGEIPSDVFDVDNVFCLIGTDPKDYGPVQQVVGVKSDGLVQIDNAYVRGAHRAFVHRSHSGPYGEVNSEEGYQNLRRFLFGTYYASADLVGLALPPDPHNAWQADVSVSIRGLPVLISEQVARHYCPVQLNFEAARPRVDSPDSPVPLTSTFLLTPSKAVTYAGQAPVSDLCRYTISLSVSHLVSDDGIFSWKNHLEQVADWTDTLIVDVGNAGSDGAISASVAWNSSVSGSPDQWQTITDGVADEQQRIRASMAGDHGSLTIPLPAVATPILGAEAKLRLTLQRRPDA